MSQEKKYQLLEEELQLYKKSLGRAADAIMDQEVSSYPIFVIHQHSVDIGILMVDREEITGKWSVNASTLEEFVTKQIIQTDKLEEFKSIYKDPEENICLFVLSELGARFVFIPRN